MAINPVYGIPIVRSSILTSALETSLTKLLANRETKKAIANSLLIAVVDEVPTAPIPKPASLSVSNTTTTTNLSQI